MAIIVDPDSLDRRQIIYNTVTQLTSAFPVGNMVDAASSGTTGYTASSFKFHDGSATFTTWGVSQGDIICIFTGTYAGHYVVDVVNGQTEITVDSDPSVFPDEWADLGSSTGLTYEIRSASGGTIEDGLTEQCYYSYSKEEWRSDSAMWGEDDLIRHQFPFEGITPEQFEIGGGATHDDWQYFNYYTKKKIRSGGWDTVNSSSVVQNSWAGMRSLGPMLSDAQGYYQQISATEPPTDFEFTGSINEPVFIWESGDDRTAYLKMFLRYKGYTYASYNLLTEQDLSTLENKLYSFPLTHVADSAITAADGEIEGSDPWTDHSTLSTDTDGYTTVSTSTFKDDDATFQTDGVQAGDCLYIVSGADAGYYTIVTVVGEDELTVDCSETHPTGFTGTSSLTYYVYTRIIIDTRSDGVIADVSGTIGQLTSATAGFSGVVNVNDILLITSSGASYDVRGVYAITSVESDSIIRVDTTDETFPSDTNVGFKIVEPGMYLQYKWDDITLGSYGNITFNENSPAYDTLVRSTGDWSADGVTVGSIIYISGATNSDNDGYYTVYEVTSATTLTLVPTDDVVQEGPTSGVTVQAFDAFKRDVYDAIEGAEVTFGFRWKLYANGGTLSDCYEFTQHQMRQSTDINWGPDIHRGDVTDVVLSYTYPTAVTYNLCLCGLATADYNSVTFTDATGALRTNKYVAAGRISFNDNLQSDAQAIYVMFFTNDDAGSDLGRDYGTKEAIVVNDNDGNPIQGNISGSSYVDYTYDYDGNIQRGSGSQQTNAPITLVAIGLETAQFVILTGTIERSKTNNFSLVANLERNYSNPS